MKIVQLVTRRQHQGAEIFASQLTEGLVQRGHEVEYIGLYRPPKDVLVPELATARDLNGEKRKLQLSLIYRLARYLDEVQPDIVQANGSDTLKYSALAKYVSRSKWPLVYRNIDGTSYFIRSALHRLWIKGLLLSVDHVASVSGESMADFQRTYQFPDERIERIPIGIYTEPVYDAEEARAKLARQGGASTGDTLIVHVASHTPKKNHEWLLEAFAGIRATRRDVHLFLIGDGPLRGRIEEKILRDGLEERVHVLRLRSDVSELMAGADFMVLPSLIEGLPAVILEAAVQGVPTVASDVGGISEVVRDDETGYCFPAHDTRAFLKAVAHMIKNPGDRRRMGENVQAFVVERYGMETIINSFEELYECIAEQNGISHRRHHAATSH